VYKFFLRGYLPHPAPRHTSTLKNTLPLSFLTTQILLPLTLFSSSPRRRHSSSFSAAAPLTRQVSHLTLLLSSVESATRDSRDLSRSRRSCLRSLFLTLDLTVAAVASHRRCLSLISLSISQSFSRSH
jgi:hypothetical protein